MSLLLRPQAACGAFRSTSSPPQRCVVCSANLSRQQRQLSDVHTHSRRQLLSEAFLLATWIIAGPAAAVCADQDTAEAGDACRAAELARDQQGDYKSLSNNREKKLAPNVPVSNLDSEYSRSTRDLAAKIETYLTLDVYDKSRQPLVKALKADGSAWVSKYARGGSARAQSARNMYIAVDAVVGFLASNGLAPFPKSKAKTVTETIGKALAFLDEGR